MAYLIEFFSVDPSTGATKLETFSDKGFTALPSSVNYPNYYYAPRVSQPGNYNRSALAEGATTGQTEAGYGAIELVNADGKLDYLIDAGLAGVPIAIYTIADGETVRENAVLIFSGVLDQPEFTWTTITLRIRDPLARLRDNIQPIVFAGTSTSGGLSPGQAEGQPSDWKGQPKPLLFGRARGIPAVQGNVYDNLWVVSSRALSGVDAVYDRGVKLTPGADYATLEALRTATVAAGTYATCLAFGTIRPGSVPVGTLTVDAYEGAAAADRRPGAVASRILQAQAGISPSNISTATFTALDLARPYEVGTWISPQQVDILSVVTEVLQSVAGFLIAGRDGFFKVAFLQPGAGLPVLIGSPTFGILTTVEVLELSGSGIERIPTTDESQGVPAYQVTVQWGKNYMVQSGTEIDQGNVLKDQKSFMASEYRSSMVSSLVVKSRLPGSVDMTFPTLLYAETDAIAEANARLAYYSVRRDRLKVPIKSSFVQGVEIGTGLTLKIPRFGMGSGKAFMVLGISEDYAAGVTTLDVIG